MSKSGNYIGGHTVITPRVGDYLAALEQKAVRARRAALRAQREYDREQALERERTLAMIKQMESRIRGGNTNPNRKRSKGMQSPKKAFVVEKIRHKVRVNKLALSIDIVRPRRERSREEF